MRPGWQMSPCIHWNWRRCEVPGGYGHLPSVVTFRLRDMRPVNVNRHLRAILNQHGERLEQGAVVTVTENRIRVRTLPIHG